MGIVFGRSGSSEPPYKTLKSVPYEIRTYDDCFVAETVASDANVAFNKLAKYFGVFGAAENNKDEQVTTSTSLSGIPMEGHGKKIAMTVPVLTDKTTMQFILPSEYKELGDVPVPTDPNVSIKCVPKRTVAVLCFYGWSSPDRCQRKFESLRQMLINDDMVDFASPPAADDTEGGADLSTHLLQTHQPYLVANYHPPFTLPCCRRVEIWITLSPNNERVAELLKAAEDPTYSTRNAVDELMESNYFEDPLDAEYGSENEEVNQELEVPTSEQVRRRAGKIVSSAEKFLGSPSQKR